MSKKIDKNSSIPAYQQLAVLLKEQIMSENLEIDSYITPEVKLAKEYSVSRMTARAALEILQDEGIIMPDGPRGKKLAKKPENSANKKMEDRNDIIIGVYPFRAMQYDDIYFGKMLDGITAGALKNKLKLKFIHRQSPGSPDGAFIETLLKENIAGILWTGPFSYEGKERTELEENNVPVTLLNYKDVIGNADYVTSNHFGGTSFLMDSLFHMGHKRIAIISAYSSEFAFAKERLAAYKEAHKKYGIELSENLIVNIVNPENPIWKNDLYEKISYLMAKSKPDALFVSAGALLYPVMNNLMEIGLRIPYDISVVCFDEMNLPDNMPKVTCVRQQVEKAASLAIDILYKRINNKNAKRFEIVIDPEFIPGSSCTFCK